MLCKQYSLELHAFSAILLISCHSCVISLLTLILIFNDICCPSITGTTDTGGVMRGTERYTVNIYMNP